MAASPINEAMRRLRRSVLLRDGAVLTDGRLLGRFIERRDEAAFAALMQRHGPMVWGVCRRLLDQHDAEDAFQATFLVLVRKAASVVPRERVANWLYGVAHQTALQARRTAARRGAREKQVTQMPEPAGAEQDLWRDLRPLLDHELSRLPAAYREVVVLSDLEGKTRREVARQLGLPEGTVGSRLARARAMLARRLTRRGVTLSAGALAAVLAQKVASAGVPPSVVESTITTASLVAAGEAASGAISVKAAALTEGVMKGMLFTKLKAAIAVLLVLGLVATGTTIFTCRTAAGEDDKKPAAEKPVEPAAKPEKEMEAPPAKKPEPVEPVGIRDMGKSDLLEAVKEAFTAWGKEFGGLQMGLGFRPGEKRAYHVGETVTLVVRVRNVGKKEVTFSYFRQFSPNELLPTVTDGGGRQVPIEALVIDIRPRRTELVLAPGKESDVYELKLDLRPASESGNRTSLTLYGAGKFYLQHERMNGMFSPEQIKLDPGLDGLATGKLELEVKDAEKLPDKEEKEGFTAWGKEVGGLQAGLGYLPGRHRTYHPGETVTLVVRVRNVGKEAVKFQYIPKFFVENPPSVTDGEGKQVHFRYGIIEMTQGHSKADVNLAPGKESKLGEVKLLTTLLGTEKFTLQYERVFANTWGATITLDPTLSKLATGKLELEVKPEPTPAAAEKK